MSAAGLLSSRVVPSYSGPPRRYYRITPLGRDVLAAWRATWLEYPHLRRFHRPTVHSTQETHVMTAATPRTVEQYLDSLRSALQGADRALVQDALYDAEEHLRAELAQHPGEQRGRRCWPASWRATALPTKWPTRIAPTRPRVQAALRTPPPQPTRSTLGRFFGVYSDPRAYLCMLYMLLALVTGIVYFTFAVTGLSLSVGLAILIIGVPFFLLFIGTTRVLALAEGRIVETMLGTRMPRRPRVSRTAKRRSCSASSRC